MHGKIKSPSVKYLLLSFLLSWIFSDISGQTLSGYVMDESNEPVPYVNVYIKFTTKGTVTDENGKYFIVLEQGDYDVVYSAVGYEQKTVQVLLKKNDVVKNVWLSPSNIQLDELVIKAKRKDPAYEIIQNAINRKDDNNHQVASGRCNVYIKASEVISEKEKKKREKEKRARTIFKSKDEEESVVPDDPHKKHQEETMKLANSLNIVEIHLERNYENPDKVKEIRNGFKKRGSSEGLYYLTTAQTEFNFYKNLLYAEDLNELPLVSPLNNTSILTYKFRLESTYFEGNKMIYHIRVIPRKQGNATFSGYIDIVEGSFAIRKVDMSLHNGGLLIYKDFRMQQEYRLMQDSLWVVERQEFDYRSKSGNKDFTGNTVVIYKDHEFNISFPKKYFNNEIAVTAGEAYERDTSYWEKIRPEPLTPKEQNIIFIKDSIEAAHNKKEYLDSIDRQYNKVTFSDIVLYGIGNFNREKKRHIYTSGLAEFVDPFQLGGISIGPDFLYFKKYEDQRSWLFYGNIHLGIRNMDLKGDVQAWHLYNPVRQSSVYLNVGHDFDVVQSTEAITSYLDRANYVEQTYLEIGHSTELINGLYFDVFSEITENRPVDGYKFGGLSEAIVKNNIPRSFNAYQLFVTNVELRYTPFQKYQTEPNRKVVLGSKWPTLTLHYKKGVPGILSSDVDFDFLEAAVKQNFKLGTIGTSSYKLGSGKFLRDKQMTYEMYKIFPRGDKWFFGNAMENQLQDSTLISRDIFFDAHFSHHFNGAIVNYFPLIKKLRINTLAGINYLFLKESTYHYLDFYFGVERVFRIQRQRFRFGLYFVYGGSTSQTGRPTLQFSINHYDQREKSWGY